MRFVVPDLRWVVPQMTPRPLAPAPTSSSASTLARIAGALTSLPVLLAMACAAAVIGCR